MPRRPNAFCARSLAGLRAVALLAGLCLASSGAAPSKAAEAIAAESLRVGAASSLRDPLEACARAFEASRAPLRVQVSYGASSVLAVQLRAGAPLDLLLTADAEIADALARADVVEAPVPLARNRLVVLARPGIAPLARPEDLAGPAIRRLAVPNRSVPVGRYARQWLQERGLLEAVSSRLVATEHARATLVAVDQGFADAAIVYATDAPLAKRARIVWEIPASEQPEIVYAAAVSRAARDPGLAGAFIAYLVSGPGREPFARAGFAPATP